MWSIIMVQGSAEKCTYLFTSTATDPSPANSNKTNAKQSLIIHILPLFLGGGLGVGVGVKGVLNQIKPNVFLAVENQPKKM